MLEIYEIHAEEIWQHVSIPNYSMVVKKCQNMSTRVIRANQSPSTILSPISTQYPSFRVS